MQKLTISAILKPVLIGTWFLILASLPFLFPNRDIPLWICAFFLFFAFIIFIQIKKYELDTNQILMKNFVTGKTSIIERAQIDYIAVNDMPATIAVTLGLMKKGRMASVLAKDKTKINISSSSAGHEKFALAEKFLLENYTEFFRT